MALIAPPTQNSALNPLTGETLVYNSAGQAATASANNAAAFNQSRGLTPTGSSVNAPGSVANQPAHFAPSVVTSKPATQEYSGIQSDYQNNIVPGMQSQTANVAANNAVPTIPNYTVSTTKTGANGEITVTPNGGGQTYYAVPNNAPAGANDIISALNAPETTTTPTGGTSTSTDTSGNSGGTPTSNPSGIDINAENANYQAGTQQIQSDLDKAYNTFQGMVTSFGSGTFPLTDAQNALVQSTSSLFDSMIQSQELRGAALSSETGGVSMKIGATAGEILNVDSIKTAAIAKLETAFQTQDFTAVKDAYDAFNTAEAQKTSLLDKMHADVLSQYNAANDLALRTATFNETVYKDSQDLANSRYVFNPVYDAFGQRIGTQAVDKQTGLPVGAQVNDPGKTDPSNPNSVNMPAVQTTGTGAPDPTSQQAFLKTVPAPYQALVQGIANGKIEPPSARTKEGAQILSWVAQYDPTLSDGTGGFDATKYQARVTMAKSLASYGPSSYGGALVSGNKVIAHLNSFLNNASAIPGKSVIRIGNGVAGNILAAGSALLGNTGPQANIATAGTEAKGLTDEMTKFFKGTGGTDQASIESWSQTLDPNAPEGTLQGVVQGTLNLFSGQLNSFIQQYTTTMGQPPSIGTIIQPQTMATLSAFKNAGYQVDIPGVNYTDPVAYANASPDNASALASIRQQFPNLTPAQALQLAQYDPNQPQ